MIQAYPIKPKSRQNERNFLPAIIPFIPSKKRLLDQSYDYNFGAYSPQK